MAQSDECAFCKISKSVPSDGEINKSDGQNQEYFYGDDQLFVIKDIKPRAPHHYLVITREHIESAKSLDRQHVDLVRRMVEVGAQVLKDRHEDGNVRLDDIHLGFHWPPLNMIKHLHMHVMYPASEMSFIMRSMVFRPGLLFVTPDWLIDRLKTMPLNQQNQENKGISP